MLAKLRYLLILIISFELFSCTVRKQSDCYLDLFLCNMTNDGKLSQESKQILLPFENLQNDIILPQG
ncbi:MAG: hypothetical protein WAT21_10805, partial [Saprospiraceae bacterium]